MNTTVLTLPPYRDIEALEARFAHRVAARLHEQANTLPADVTERLRFARQQALEQARASRTKTVPVATTVSVVQQMGAATAAFTAGGFSSWWMKLGALVPLLALLAGLAFIEQLHNDDQIRAAAEIDAALLADSLPPEAYRDEGFAEFLKTAQE